MNKFAADGLIVEALCENKTIVVFSSSALESQIAFDEVVARTEESGVTGAKVSRANGNQRISFGAGKIEFASVPAHARFRGTNAEIVFIDRDADRTALWHDEAKWQRFLADIASLTSTSSVEIIRA